MTYEFFCCGESFEIEQSMVEEHKATCPKCGKPAQRIFSPLRHYWVNPRPLYHKDGSYEEKY